MSILLGGVGGHPAEVKKWPSTLHFRYEHPRIAPLGSAGAVLTDEDEDGLAVDAGGDGGAFSECCRRICE